MSLLTILLLVFFVAAVVLLLGSLASLYRYLMRRRLFPQLPRLWRPDWTRFMITASGFVVALLGFLALSFMTGPETPPPGPNPPESQAERRLDRDEERVLPPAKAMAPPAAQTQDNPPAEPAQEAPPPASKAEAAPTESQAQSTDLEPREGEPASMAPPVEEPAAVGEQAQTQARTEPQAETSAQAEPAQLSVTIGPDSQAQPAKESSVAAPSTDTPTAQAPEQAKDAAAQADASQTSQATASPLAPQVATKAEPAATPPPPAPKPAPKPKVEQVPLPKPKAPRKGWTVCAASHKKKKDAANQARSLVAKGMAAQVVTVDLPKKGTWHRVCVGVFPNSGKAKKQADAWEKQGLIKDSFVVRLP